MRTRGTIAVVLLAACGRATGAPEGVGTLEAVEVRVAPTIAARVVALRVEEGAIVHRGDTLALLTTPTLSAERTQRQARAAAARSAVSELDAGARTDERRRAEAELAAADADAQRTAADSVRVSGLAARQIVSAQQLDGARAAARAAGARRDAARAALALVTEGARAERRTAARAELAGAEGAVAALTATASDLVLIAPIDGQVISRAAEVGEVVAPGQAVFTLADPSRPTVRVFVSEDHLPFINPGDSVEARLDALPDAPFRGRVAAISPRAEFTPRVALTEKERADLLFAVKIVFTDSTHRLKAGLPVTVRFPRAATP